MKILKNYQYKQSLNLLSILFVTLFISACGGGSSDASSPPPPVVNQAPNAVITVNQNSGIAPATIEFSGTSSTDADGSIATYAWDFTSDGSIDDNNATTSFAYQDAGTYSATLTVTDDDGANSTSTIEINVERAAEKILFRARKIDDPNLNNLNLFVMNDDGTDLIQLNNTDPTRTISVNNVQFSPDGQWVAYIEFDGNTQNLMVNSTMGGDAIRLNQDIQMDQQLVTEFAWSPDSSQIAYTINSGPVANTGLRFAREVWLVNRDGTEQVKISGRIGNIVEVSEPTPNSTRLFTTENATSNIFITKATSNTGSKICFLAGTTSGIDHVVSDASLPAPNAEVISSSAAGVCRWSDDDSRILTTTSDFNQNIDQLQVLDPGNMNSPITYVVRDIGGTPTFLSGSERWRPGSNDEISYQSRESSTSSEKLLLRNANGDTIDLGIGSEEDDTRLISYFWNRNGSTVVYNRYYNATESFDLFVVNADGSNTLNLTEAVPESDAINRFFWSQDTSHILFDTSDGTDPNNRIHALYSVSREDQETMEITGKIFSRIRIVGYQPKP